MLDLLTQAELQKMFGSIDKAAAFHGKTKQAFYQAIDKPTGVCNQDLTVKVIGTVILEGVPHLLPARFLTNGTVSIIMGEDPLVDLFESEEESLVA